MEAPIVTTYTQEQLQAADAFAAESPQGLTPEQRAKLRERYLLDKAAALAMLAELEAALFADEKLQRMTPEAKAAMRSLFMTNRKAAEEIAAGIPEPLPSRDMEKVADAFAKSLSEKVTWRGRRTLRDLFLKDPETARKIAAGVPALPAGQKLPNNEAPPKPMHSLPGDEGYEPSPEQKTHESAMLIKTVQSEGRFKDYTTARDEARRRSPELFR